MTLDGAAVSVVKDGRVIFSKGYGYADVEVKTPVTPDATLFRPGSITKLFTWTAVMQLVEQGRLDLDRDVNDYLDFTIPARSGGPVTLRAIMTHTSSFEEISIMADPLSRGQFLKEHLPRRIFPVGSILAYSNYAAALAGYIVERVPGGQRLRDSRGHGPFHAGASPGWQVRGSPDHRARGDTTLFHSALHLIPDAGVGFAWFMFASTLLIGSLRI